MEFLGHLLVNTGRLQCIALTASRQTRMEERLGEWLGRAPVGDEVVSAGPREVAVLLGHLVFCSQVIPRGRTYMQAMLRQFVGLEVDWLHGAVRLSGEMGAWRQMVLWPGFWRDLLW